MARHKSIGGLPSPDPGGRWRWRSRRGSMAPAAALLLALALAPLAGGCAGPEPAPPQPTVRVFKPLGTVQCSGGGTDLATLARQLAGAGLRPLNSGCGTDGRMHVAMCGASDGRIAIFELAEQDLPTAATLGFLPLAGLPTARAVPCR